MYNGVLKDKNQLLELIKQKSDYSNQIVEGIYLKIFDGDYVDSRCKLVRNDFIIGNTHWKRRETIINKLIY